jgi:hypothetical protein
VPCLRCGLGGRLSRMTEQLGKHNASGPVARRADGTIDPAGYVKSRLGDRRNLAFHAVLVIVSAVGLGVRSGSSRSSMLAFVAGLLILEFGIVFAVRFAAGHRERRRRSAGQPPSWPAGLMAVLQTREAGFEIPADIRNDSGLRGRLTDDGDRWTWATRSTRTRPVGPTIVLDGSWSPDMDHRLGYRHILTFTDQRGARLDFGIAPRRDLLHHLQKRR